MRILGVDPGTVVTGWGVIDCDGRRLSYVDSGVIRPGEKDIAARLGRIHAALVGVIARLSPQVLSLERNFLARNVQSAFRLGEARGVAMAAAAAADVELNEYTPATIKKSIVGHGRADKDAVQAVIVRMLGLTRAPLVDEADALAAAACHGLRRGYETKLAAARGRVPVRAGVIVRG